MTKFPFSPEGATAMCQHYFQLPDALLAEAASALKNDFGTWVSENFTLTDSQSTFLNAIAPQAIEFMATNASFALANRRPILIAKEGELGIGSRESKLVKPKSRLTTTITPTGDYTFGGDFLVEITY